MARLSLALMGRRARRAAGSADLLLHRAWLGTGWPLLDSTHGDPPGPPALPAARVAPAGASALPAACHCGPGPGGQRGEGPPLLGAQLAAGAASRATHQGKQGGRHRREAVGGALG